MSEKPMQETLGYLLVQVAKAHRNVAGMALADFGLYIGQEILLMYLWETEGLTPSELAELVVVEPPTLTKMLQRLEKAGILERRPDENDARSYKVYLTEAGRTLQEPITDIWNVLEKRILTDMTLEEQLLLRRLLLQVHRNLT